jgi:hypothetical protein
VDVNSAEDHRTRALGFFQAYIDMQDRIEAIEDKVVQQCGGNKLMAKQMLADYYDRKTGRKYPTLCALREMYMDVAQLSATMVIMLKQPRD